MIRAHLATFPPRRRILRRVVDAILPQVDHLFIVLNDYDSVPGYIAKDSRITAVIPDRDVKDAGKFWFTPDPGDLVFLIDDDIGYPPDYVAHSIAELDRLGRKDNVVGYLGNALVRDAGQQGWRTHLFAKSLAETLGVNIVGTGTVCALGANIPPLDAVEHAAGFVDFGYAAWLKERGILPWVLPHPEGWMTNNLPHNLWKSSLLVTVNRKAPPPMTAELRKCTTGWPHVNIPFEQYRQGAV